MFMRLLRILGLSLVLAFALFGALASLEPTSTGGIHDGWLLGYAAIGSGAVLLLAREIRRCFATRRRRQQESTAS